MRGATVATKDEQLAADVREAQKRYPGCTLEAKEFAALLAQRSDLGEVAHVQDLYVCTAALQGDGVAIAALSSLVGAASARLLTASNPDKVDEVAQRIRVRLLSPLDGSAPKLAQYRGRAALGTWLRVIAARESLLITRSPENARRDDRTMAALRDPCVPTGVQMDRESYVALFKTTFHRHFEALSIHDRTLLRQHYRDGIPIFKLAVVRGVHRGTLARELAQIRGRLENAVSSDMRIALKLSAEEQNRLQGELASQLEASLSRLFRETPA